VFVARIKDVFQVRPVLILKARVHQGQKQTPPYVPHSRSQKTSNWEQYIWDPRLATLDKALAQMPRTVTLTK